MNIYQYFAKLTRAFGCILLPSISGWGASTEVTLAELHSGLYYGGGDLAVSPDGSVLGFETSIVHQRMLAKMNGAFALLETRTGALQDFAGSSLNWRLSAKREGITLSPDGTSIASPLTFEGRQCFGLRDLHAPTGKSLLSLPATMYGDFLGFSADNQGAYLRVSMQIGRAEVQRSKPEEDNPPTENNHAFTRVDRSYFPDVDRSDIVQSYPGAFALRTRDIVVYLDLKTQEVRRVLSGNDCWMQLFPDRRRMLVIQGKDADFYVRDPERKHDQSVMRDFRVVDLPPPTSLPLINLKRASEEEANAGWFDHKLERMQEPQLKDMPDYDDPLISPDGSRIALRRGYRATPGKAELWVWDLKSGTLSNLSKAIVKTGFTPRVTARPGMPQTSQEFACPSLAGNQACWEADSQALLVVEDGYLWRIPADGKSAENISARGTVAIRNLIGNEYEDRGYWAPANDEILLITTDETTMRDGIGRYNLKTNQYIPLVRDAPYISVAKVAGGNREIYYSALDEAGYYQIYSTSADGELGKVQGKQLTHFKPDMAGRILPKRELLSFKLPNGNIVWGRLYLPSHTKEKPPLILTVGDLTRGYSRPTLWANKIGGPESVRIWRTSGVFAGNTGVDTLNRAGYAVFCFDFPFDGWEYPAELTPVALRELYEAAVDAAIDTKKVDGARVAFWDEGGDPMMSNFSLRVLCDSKRFSAAAFVEAVGLPMVQSLSQIPTPGNALRFIGRDYPESVNPVATPERFENLAAIPKFKGLSAPLLFMQNKNDRYPGNVLANRTDELFNASQMAGVKSVAVYYRRGVTTGEQYRRAILWFNEHLRGGPAVAWKATLPPTTAAEFNEGSDAIADGPGEAGNGNN